MSRLKRFEIQDNGPNFIPNSDDLAEDLEGVLFMLGFASDTAVQWSRQMLGYLTSTYASCIGVLSQENVELRSIYEDTLTMLKKQGRHNPGYAVELSSELLF